jgi:hypothetical protein
MKIFCYKIPYINFIYASLQAHIASDTHIYVDRGTILPFTQD